jgi:type II secretion system protein L
MHPTTLLYREGLSGSNWLARRLDGAGAVRRGQISQILQPGEKVVLLLPGDDAAARLVDLPNIRGAERREAALSILEPDLAQTVDALMLGCFASVNKQTLAVWVSKSRLAAWLGGVNAAGAFVVAAVPEWGLLYQVRDEHTAQAWRSGEKTWVISRRGIAVCVECALAGVVMEKMSVDDADAALNEFVDKSGCVRGDAEFSWLALWNRVGKVEQMDLRRVAELTSQARAPMSFRRLLAGLAFACLAAGGFVGVELNALEAERDRWDANSAAVFRAAFPDGGRVVDVKRQMKLKLRALGASANRGLETLALLDGLARIAESNDAVKITGVQYESGRLIVSLRAQAISDIERLRAAAAKKLPEFAPRLQQLVATTGEAQGELHLGASR